VVAGATAARRSGARAAARAGGGTLGPWVCASFVLHATALTALIVVSSRTPPALPPVYRVNIVAAPPGPRQEGVVVPEKAPDVPPLPVAPPRRPEQLAVAPAIHAAPPTAAPPRATPTSTPTPAKPKPAPKAGGGPEGGAGTDVANVHIDGVDFPYPAYLENIVRQVALNFAPLDRTSGLRAEVAFLIHRDGTVSDLRFVTRAPDYGFNLEAQGAVQAAAKSFGPLPPGFHDDVLPVVFSFDPQLLK
jgi:outer membrane biosynthesis protein TonB